jgi:hypothetical protein
VQSIAKLIFEYVPTKKLAILMKLRYDPYQIFQFSKTPVGLYARQKWLGEAETPQWRIDCGKAEDCKSFIP